jgi:hypothetical protein
MLDERMELTLRKLAKATEILRQGRPVPKYTDFLGAMTDANLPVSGMDVDGFEDHPVVKAIRLGLKGQSVYGQMAAALEVYLHYEKLSAHPF